MRDSLKRRIEALERRPKGSAGRYRVMMVFDGDPEPIHPDGAKVIRLDFN